MISLPDNVTDSDGEVRGGGRTYDSAPSALRHLPQHHDLLGDLRESSADLAADSASCVVPPLEGCASGSVARALALSGSGIAMARLREAKSGLHARRLECQQAAALTATCAGQRVARRRRRIINILPKRWFRFRFAVAGLELRTGLRLMQRDCKRGVGRQHRSVPC